MFINKPSPNFSSRDGNTPKYICIHVMAGTMQSTDFWFKNNASQVSSHYGVSLTGDVHQYVDEKMSAWANGLVVNPTAQIVKDNINLSQNKISISIEHEGYDLSTGPQTQLNSSAQLIKNICSRWDIPLNRKHIIGHSEIRSTKPNCPSPNLAIVDRLISLVQGLDEMVSVKVPKSKQAKAEQFLANL